MTERKLVTVDFASVTGQIKPLHGMCNGPLSPGADLSELFCAMGVPQVRFADLLQAGSAGTPPATADDGAGEMPSAEKQTPKFSPADLDF